MHKLCTEWCARTGKEYSVSIGTFINTAAAKPLKSKIQTFCAGFWGFWILDRYVAILLVRPPVVQILDFGAGFWILDFEPNFGFYIR